MWTMPENKIKVPITKKTLLKLMDIDWAKDMHKRPEKAQEESFEKLDKYSC